MKASKRHLRDQWAQKVWFTLEFWMLRSRLSRRDLDIDALEEVVLKVRSIPTFKTFLKAAKRESRKKKQTPHLDAAASLYAPSSEQLLVRSLYLRHVSSQWKRETPPHTEPE